MPNEPGQSCTSPSECASGFCAQGVCCDRACNGACERCDQSGTGTCQALALPEVCPQARGCQGGELYQRMTCDGLSADCVPVDSALCAALGCTAASNGDAYCTECDDAHPCGLAGQSCVEGRCQQPQPFCRDTSTLQGGDGALTPCAPTQICVNAACREYTACTTNAECLPEGGACTYGKCIPPGSVPPLAIIPPVEFDGNCGCRLPGAPPGPAPTLVAMLVIVLAGLRVRRVRRWRARGGRAAQGAVVMIAAALLAGCPLPSQEDLPADEACRDTGYALSNLVLECTSDYDKAVRVGEGFEGSFRCNGTNVNETPRYYRCPAEIRALGCEDVAAFDEDMSKYLGRSPACRFLFSRLDGSPLPAVERAGGAP